MDDADSRRRAADLPIIHLDQHFWKPGWVEPDRKEWNRNVGYWPDPRPCDLPEFRFNLTDLRVRSWTISRDWASTPRREALGDVKKAVEGVQRVAHMALVRVQTRTDDEA